MLEVTRVNLECQLESSPSDNTIILKLIDTRKYIAFQYQLTSHVEEAIKEFDATIALVELIKDKGDNWKIYAENIFNQANASYELNYEIEKIALPNYMELRDLYIKKINGGKDITEEQWSYCTGSENDNEDIKDQKVILGEILNKIEEANDEVQNKEVYSEIVEKTKAMKDTEEKEKFDAVNKEIDGNVLDISSTIKRKRNEDCSEHTEKNKPETITSETAKSEEVQKYESNGMGSKTFKRMDDD